jgi:type IV secretion system protein VirB1
LLPDMDVMNCPSLAVPNVVMQHVVEVESAFNRYAIGVVGGRLVRQPRTLDEAVATARMLAARGYNFSLGLAQVNRHNLGRLGLDTYAKAFGTCTNLQAGARILGDCLVRARNDWGKAFSCYYSGNFTSGFRDGYVAKVFASMQAGEVAASIVPRSWAARRASGFPMSSHGGTAVAAPDLRVSSAINAPVPEPVIAEGSAPPSNAVPGARTHAAPASPELLLDVAFVF